MYSSYRAGNGWEASCVYLFWMHSLGPDCTWLVFCNISVSFRETSERTISTQLCRSWETQGILGAAVVASGIPEDGKEELKVCVPNKVCNCLYFSNSHQNSVCAVCVLTYLIFSGPSSVFKIVKMIMERNFQPVIIFSFSKKECEAYALQVAKLDFNRGIIIFSTNL